MCASMSRWGCDGEAQVCFENTFVEYSEVILHTQVQYTKDKILHVIHVLSQTTISLQFNVRNQRKMSFSTLV